MKKGEKTFRVNEKAYEKLSEHIGVLPIVMVSPYDTSIVNESAEERRRFMNMLLSQLDREYLHALQSYNRILLQRNSLLRAGNADRSLLAVFDSRLSAPVVYRSDLDAGDMESLLFSTYGQDTAAGHTTKGIHRDELEFMTGGLPLRKCGSQGQQKSFTVALKFAQYAIMREVYGFPPLMLLDDLFDNLDLSRVSNLLRIVLGKGFGQIFITDCNKQRMKSIVDSMTEEKAYFEVKSGVFTPINI